MTQALLPVPDFTAGGGAACRTARSGCATSHMARATGLHREPSSCLIGPPFRQHEGPCEIGFRGILLMSDVSAALQSENGEYAEMRLYSPGLLAAYTILGNVPLGLFLYGLNLMARGYRRYGKLMMGSAILTGLWLFVLFMNTPTRRLPAIPSIMFGLICGISIYKSEMGPYQKAIAAGATKARWWPPLLVLIGFMATVGLWNWIRA